MSEETNPAPTPTPRPTPTGNQNLVIGLVLGAVVLLLFLLVLQLATGRFGGASSETGQVAELKARRDALLDKRTQSPAQSQSALAIAERLKLDSTTLAELATQLQTALAARETDLNSTRSLYQSALTELNTANQRLANTNANAERVAGLERDAADKHALLQQADARIADLLSQLNAAPRSGDLETMRTAYNDAVQQRDDFRRQLTELESKARGMVAADQAGDLSEENQRLRKEVDDLKSQRTDLLYELQKIRADLDHPKLFIEEVDDLPAPAKALYQELAKFESASAVELSVEYERLGDELKSRPIDAIRFQTNSARIDLDKVEEIRRALQAADDDAYFLVVGYSSKSGSLDTNRQLSFERATTIASVANASKKGTQAVNAVFLAETNRFSPTELERNQVCEIWEIKK